MITLLFRHDLASILLKVSHRSNLSDRNVLKITTILDNPRSVHLALEGKVADQWAALLDGVCRAHLREHKSVRLDCAHVDFVDASGLDVLRNLPRRHVSLLHAPGFITELLLHGEQP
jgi:ABC-type transporter Mla MlaB component